MGKKEDQLSFGVSFRLTEDEGKALVKLLADANIEEETVSQGVREWLRRKHLGTLTLNGVF